jgi:hypothetical protein
MIGNVFYGDKLRWFTGTVTQIGDRAGRVQVYIYGIHSESISSQDLPWAPVVMPTTEGGTSGYGRNPYLQPGAFVFGFFLDGKLSQSPMILGSLSQTHVPSFTQKRFAQESGNNTILNPNNLSDDGSIFPENLNNLAVNDATRPNKIFSAMSYLTTGVSESDPGLPPRSAAAVVGNLIGENYNLDPALQSKFKSSAIVPTNNQVTTVSVNQGFEPSFGIAQWNASKGVERWQKFEKYAAKRNLPTTNFKTQLEYLRYDMRNGGIHRCWIHLSNESNFDYETPASFGEERSANRNPTHHFIDVFEKAAYNQNELDKREKHAREALQIFEAGLSV